MPPFMGRHICDDVLVAAALVLAFAWEAGPLEPSANAPDMFVFMTSLGQKRQLTAKKAEWGAARILQQRVEKEGCVLILLIRGLV